MTGRLRANFLFALECVTSCLLFLMMGLTFADVLGRYAFSAPIYGAAEMIQFLLAGVVFSALGVVSARGGHIAVELFTGHITKHAPVLHSLFINLFAAAALVLIGSRLWAIGLEAWHTDKVTIVLEWSLAFVAFPSAAFCFLAALLGVLSSEGRL